jgi:hypothetical protein
VRSAGNSYLLLGHRDCFEKPQEHNPSEIMVNPEPPIVGIVFVEQIRNVPLPRIGSSLPQVHSVLQNLFPKSPALPPAPVRAQSRSGGAILYRNWPIPPLAIPKMSLMNCSCTEAFSKGPA